jgi:glycosyltransferase involved in cell wall biosynthesis
VYLLDDALVSITAPENLFFPFRQIYKLKRGTTIPIGIPVKRITNAEPALLTGIRLSVADQFMLFVGRLSPEKNISLLLQSLHQLSGEYTRLRLVICGEGRERTRLEDQARQLGISDKVHFIGYREDVYSIMKACDLLILPSLWEGMGNVLFEALAAGLPAVASKIPALEYWFEDQEIVSLFDPHSLDELTDCIRRELERPAGEKEHRREEAYQFVKELDIDVMVRKFTDFYTELRQR